MGWQVSSALQTVTWITLSPPTVLYLFSLIFAMSVLSCICICKLSLERLCPQLQLHAFVVVIAIVNIYCCWTLPVLRICLFVCHQWIPFFAFFFYFIVLFHNNFVSESREDYTKWQGHQDHLYFLFAFVFSEGKKACKVAGSPGLLLQREKSEECENRAASSYFNHHPQFALISGSLSAKL